MLQNCLADIVAVQPPAPAGVGRREGGAVGTAQQPLQQRGRLGPGPSSALKRVNVSGDPHARIAKPAWFNRLRQDLVGTPERNEANVIIALTSDIAFAGVLAFDDFSHPQRQSRSRGL